MKKSFIIYMNWAEIIKRLPTDAADELIKAICSYQTGEHYEIENPYIVAIFEGQILPKLAEDAENYNREVQRRSEAGKKGMKTRWKDNKVITEDNSVITNDNSVINSDNKGITKITDTDTDTVTDTDKDIYIRPSADTRHKYGEYKHVLLKDAELEKLNKEYGESQTNEAIRFLDEYIEMKGTKYKSHYLALRKWVFDAVKEKKPKHKFSSERDIDFAQLEKELLRK